MKNTRKSVWEVTYSVPGALSARKAYFATKTEAEDFYNSREYVDKPVHKMYGAKKADALIGGYPEDL